MKRWYCVLCGYIYDPDEGDHEGGIAAGTPFDELPRDWACPLCAGGKEDFEEMD